MYGERVAFGGAFGGVVLVHGGLVFAMPASIIDSTWPQPPFWMSATASLLAESNSSLPGQVHERVCG